MDHKILKNIFNNDFINNKKPITEKGKAKLYNHQLTDKGLKAFLDDWAKTGQSILPK